MKAALYARVSTINHQQDPELQLRELRQYCQQRGLEVVAEYVDRVSSSKVRPKQEQMMGDATKHKFDVVLVWRFDRFSRSAIELATALERFRNLNISFVSITEQIDTSTATGELVLTILGAVAKMERSMIQERVCAGLRNAVAKGHKLGRPTIITNPLIKKVKSMKGKTLREIAKHVGVSHVTVARLLKTA